MTTMTIFEARIRKPNAFSDEVTRHTTKPEALAFIETEHVRYPANTVINIVEVKMRNVGVFECERVTTSKLKRRSSAKRKLKEASV